MEHKLKIGITHGDINGVGYEVILKTLSDPRIVELCTPVVYGSSKVAAYHRKALDLPPFNFNIITSAEQCAAGKINMINCFDDELKVELSKNTTEEEVNAAVKEASESSRLKGILGYNDLPLVSVDFTHTSFSSIFHADQTKVIDGNFLRILSWYDNEWGFSNRMSDTAVAMAKFI